MNKNKKQLQTILEEVIDISRIPMLLYTAEGEPVAHTAIPEPALDETVAQFIASDIENQTLGSYQYFKIHCSGTLSGVLLAGNFTPDASIVARLTVCQIRRLLEAQEDTMTRPAFLRSLVCGTLTPAETERQRKHLKVPSSSWAVFLVESDEGFADTCAYQMLEQAFAGQKADLCCEMEDDRLLLAKDVSKHALDYAQFAQTIVDTMRAELLIQTHVGYSATADGFHGLRQEYQKAATALQIRRTFFAERDTVAYNRLGFERLIAALPIDLCETYLKEVFGDHIPDNLSEEEQNTIQKFYENNLNISETARQLYLHRNTLVYRLERLEKTLGLDIRRFEDAMTFKLAMQVLAHVRESNRSDNLLNGR